MKDFISSVTLILSWFGFAVSAYLLYWTIIMPAVVILPFLIALILGFLLYYVSKKLDDRKKSADQWDIIKRKV